ncbi:hypothetical protein VNO77_37250 [Canavalia gladiata]|uniref:Uncharacterized protein n=1 Tax=Canavalia gladiata TaxID=3824 RepID=A0AAN9KBA4_CANGL
MRKDLNIRGKFSLISLELKKKGESSLLFKISLYSLEGNSPRKKESHQASSNLSKEDIGMVGKLLTYLTNSVCSKVVEEMILLSDLPYAGLFPRFMTAFCHYIVLSISTNWKERIPFIPWLILLQNKGCVMLGPLVPLSPPFLVLSFSRIPTKRYMGAGNLHSVGLSDQGLCSAHLLIQLHVIDPHDPKLHDVIDLAQLKLVLANNAYQILSPGRIKRHYNPKQQLDSSGQLNQGPCKRRQVQIPCDAICFKFKRPQYQLMGHGNPSTRAAHRFHAP